MRARGKGPDGEGHSVCGTARAGAAAQGHTRAMPWPIAAHSCCGSAVRSQQRTECGACCSSTEVGWWWRGGEGMGGGGHPSVTPVTSATLPLSSANPAAGCGTARAAATALLTSPTRACATNRRRRSASTCTCRDWCDMSVRRRNRQPVRAVFVSLSDVSVGRVHGCPREQRTMRAGGRGATPGCPRAQVAKTAMAGTRNGMAGNAAAAIDGRCTAGSRGLGASVSSAGG